jgi:molybdopterin-guanine dinucleotide biosynthesis protein A
MTPSGDAVVVLAGGRATRFPGKLEQCIGGKSMLERVIGNARETGLPVYLSGSRAFSPAIAQRFNLPVLDDCWPGGGPLRALFSACGALACERVFALAGDEPLASARLFRTLDDAWQSGDEAVVPRHDMRSEPLAAIYSRAAFLREGGALLARGDAAMRSLLERLRARFVSVDGAYFTNVNAPEDLERVARMVAG